MFGKDTESVPTRIYNYGAKAPVLNKALVDHQLMLQQRYRNVLVELERKRIMEVDRIRKEYCPELAEATGQYEALTLRKEELNAVIGKVRATNKKRILRIRQGAIPDDRTEQEKLIDQASAERDQVDEERSKPYAVMKACWARLKEDPVLQAQLDEFHEAHAKAKIEARTAIRTTQEDGSMGLYHGSYVKTEAETIRPRIVKLTSEMTPDERVRAARAKAKNPLGLPNFKPATGNNKLAVQIQPGVHPDKIYDGIKMTYPVGEFDPHVASSDTHARIVIDTTTNPKRPWATLWMRIQSDASKRTVWTTVRFRLHRPLPDHCEVRWVYLLRRRVATTTKWFVQFVVASHTGFHRSCGTYGRVGVDIGYRQCEWIVNGERQTGMRVAYWMGEDGAEGQLVIPQRWLDARRKMDDLQSIRTKEFNLMRDKLVAWLKARGKENLPEELVTETATLASWRSEGRLAALVLRWRGDDPAVAAKHGYEPRVPQRFAGDEEMLTELEAWRKQDKHLYLWWGHGNKRLENQRLEYYRRFAARLRESYSVVAMEKLNLAQLARLAEIDEPKIDGGIRHHRVRAALSYLVDALCASGMTPVKHPPENTTRTCHLCQTVTKFADQKPLMLTCSGCGEEWDQDRNAAINLLRAPDPCEALQEA